MKYVEASTVIIVFDTDRHYGGWSAYSAKVSFAVFDTDTNTLTARGGQHSWFGKSVTLSIINSSDGAAFLLMGGSNDYSHSSDGTHFWSPAIHINPVNTL